MVWPKYAIRDADWSISRKYLNGPISISYQVVLYFTFSTTDNSHTSLAFPEVWQITSDSNTLICKYLICELICLFSEKQALIWVFDLPWEVIWIDLNWNSGWIDLKFKSNANHWPYYLLPNLINSTHQLPTIIMIFPISMGLPMSKRVHGTALLVIWRNTYLWFTCITHELSTTSS